MEERLLAINPKLKLQAIKNFLEPFEITDLLEGNEFDYVVDCIDSFTPKMHLIEGAKKRGFPLVSSMGAGGKVDPTQIKVVDFADTHQCKLAKMLRKRLKRRNIVGGFKAVFSTEEMIKESLMLTDGKNFKKSAYGTMSFLPAAFGCACAATVINDLLAS
jgi:tRNA A37 threonylcarbamoyladenosine dehydratase